MSDNDNIVSIGDDFRRYPRRFWGLRDRARQAQEEQRAAKDNSWILPGIGNKPPAHVFNWKLYGHTEQDEERQRRQNLIRLEEKAGLRPRRW